MSEVLKFSVKIQKFEMRHFGDFQTLCQGVETTTSPPNGCKFEGTYRYDGEVFTAADECNRCWCNRGEIICPFQDECENIVAKRRSLSNN